MSERKADLHKQHDAGHYQNTEDRAASRLALAIHQAESDSPVVSWSAQERAQAFFNAKGLLTTLGEGSRLQRLCRPSHKVTAYTVTIPLSSNASRQAILDALMDLTHDLQDKLEQDTDVDHWAISLKKLPPENL